MLVSSSFPPCISTALGNLQRGQLPVYVTHSRPGLVRAMRSQHQKTVVAVLCCLLRHMDCESGRVVRPMQGGTWLLLTADWIARQSGCCRRTVHRVLRLLIDLGLVTSEQQPRPERHQGTMLFAGVVRRVTDKLFALLGISELRNQDRQYAKGKVLSALLRRPVRRHDLYASQKPLSVQLDELREMALRDRAAVMQCKPPDR